MLSVFKAKYFQGYIKKNVLRKKVSQKKNNQFISNFFPKMLSVLKLFSHSFRL